MSEALAVKLSDNVDQQQVKKSKPSATITKPCEMIPLQEDQTFELFPDFEDNDVPSEELLKVLTQIENENSQIIPVSDKQK